MEAVTLATAGLDGREGVGGNIGGGEDSPSFVGDVPALLSPSLRLIPDAICLVAVDRACLALAPA